MPDKVKNRPYGAVIQKLRQVNLRPTRQRLALAKLLFEGENRHVTAEMLHEEVTESNFNVSLATVYNSLHQFTDAGLLREVVVGSGQTYFDTNTADHHHYYMEKEGCLKDIPDGEIDFSMLPDVPSGKKFARVEVIIHVTEDV